LRFTHTMHRHNLENWEHDHIFGQHQKRVGERRTFIVIALTGSMMVIEIFTGILFGSMALLADGLHMASHTVALGINAFAYVYARQHAHDARFNFGTGKVNALGGFSGAILLALFAVLMVWESIHRLMLPVEIVYNQAITVAVFGLIVNGICVFILGGPEDGHVDGQHSHHHDHNLKSAYLHVMADALTSVLAIIALITAKYFGLIWMDPMMGIVGAVLVARWSIRLLQSTSHVLLDRQGPDHIMQQIRKSIEKDGNSKIADFHLWSIGPNIYALVLTVITNTPISPEEYKNRIPENLGLVHVSIEVNKCFDIS
jgi:cation diffusion facilitator family transporter